MRTNHNVHNVKDTQHHASTPHPATGPRRDSLQDNLLCHLTLLVADLPFPKLHPPVYLARSTLRPRL